jgi:transcriptional regulator GlxA family with amidase domain
MEVAIVVFDGFDELDAIGPYEVFATAGQMSGEGDVTLVTLEPTDSVQASHGLRIEPGGSLAEVDPDLLVVPGGGWGAGGGVRDVVDEGALPQAVAELHADGVRVASVCTGAMVLSTAGLLEGRPATTHAVAVADLAAAGAELRDARAVDDGDVLTAGGVTAGLDLAFHVVERKVGADVAERVAREMEYEPSDDVVTG